MLVSVNHHIANGKIWITFILAFISPISTLNYKLITNSRDYISSATCRDFFSKENVPKTSKSKTRLCKLGGRIRECERMVSDISKNYKKKVFGYTTHRIQESQT